jgi:YbgC/YbaW family acyl-CoA thioester hydrolase
MFTTERIVEFGMCDSAGILFFAKIFELFHSIYEEFVLSSNLDNNYFENETFAIPLISSNADFHKPIAMHEVLQIELSVVAIGDSSFRFKTEFYNEEHSLKATVNTTHVFVRKDNFNKLSIPEEFRNLLKENERE